MVIYIIISALLIGWLIAQTDSIKLFGIAVGNKLHLYKNAILVSSVCIIAGALIYGNYTTRTITSFAINDSPVSVTVVLFASIVVYFIFYRLKIYSSILYSIIGALAGWSYFTNNSNGIALTKEFLIIWIIAPILGAMLSAGIYFGVKQLLKKLKIHIIILDVYLRWLLLLAIIISAFYFGANNIAIITGIFINFAPNLLINLGFTTLSGFELICIISALALISGIVLSKNKINQIIENEFTSLPEEASVVVVFVLGIVLFLFTSPAISSIYSVIGINVLGIIPIPIAPVIVGNIIGIKLLNGIRKINLKVPAEMSLSWILTPILSGFLVSLILYIATNYLSFQFNNKIQVDNIHKVIENTRPNSTHVVNLIFPFMLIISILILILFIYFIYKQQKFRLQTEKKLIKERNEYFTAQQALTDSNLRAMQLENAALSNKLEFKHKELMFYALNIVEQHEYLNNTYQKLKEIQKLKNNEQINSKINELIISVKQKMTFSDEVENFYHKVEEMNRTFSKKLLDRFPDLTENEQKLVKLLKLGFSSKEIAPLLNISAKSVEINRYRLRKKLKLEKGDNLLHFINTI